MQKEFKPHYRTAQADMYRAIYDNGSCFIACEPYENRADCEKRAIADFGVGNFEIETLPVGTRIFVYQ